MKTETKKLSNEEIALILLCMDNNIQMNKDIIAENEQGITTMQQNINKKYKEENERILSLYSKLLAADQLLTRKLHIELKQNKN